MFEIQNVNIGEIVVGIFLLFVGIVNYFARSTLRRLEKNDDEIYKRLNDNDKELALLKGEHITITKRGCNQ